MVGQAQDRAGPRQGLGLPGYGLKAKTVVSSWERDGRWRLGDWDVGRLETGLSVCPSVRLPLRWSTRCARRRLVATCKRPVGSWEARSSRECFGIDQC